MLLLENLRFHPEEEANDEGFAKELASLAAGCDAVMCIYSFSYVLGVGVRQAATSDASGS